MKTGFTHESTYNESKEWYTPAYIFAAMGAWFDMDVASPGREIVPWIPADRHLTYLDNGLLAEWNGFVWMNPPYGTDTPVWLSRLSAHRNGVALLFARTDTRWFSQYVVNSDAILFIKGRVQFIPADRASEYAEKKEIIKNSGCGAGSMLVAYGPTAFKALKRAEECGLGYLYIRPGSKHCCCSGLDTGSSVKLVSAPMPTASPYENAPANAKPGLLF